MSDKTLVFLWVLIAGALLGRRPNHLRYEYDTGGNVVLRATPGYAWILFLPIILLVSLGHLRSDMYLYMAAYNSLPSTLSGAIESIRQSERSGIGWLIFELTVKLLTGGNLTAFRVVLALAQSIPLIVIYRRYSPNYGISVYLFVAFGYHLAFMMNGMRQFLACTTIFAATPWMLERKNLQLILVILLASTIHTSAIIMLPIVFIVRGEAWNWKTLVSLFASVVATVVFARVTGSFDSLLSGTEYAGTMAAMSEYGDDGVNPIRVLVVAVPMALAFWGRNRLDTRNAMLNMCVNFSVFTFCITLIAMVTSGIMVGRLPVYTNLYNFILLPELIDRLFDEQTRPLVSFAMVVLFLIYYSVECGF